MTNRYFGCFQKCIFSALIFLSGITLSPAAPFLIKDGEPKAEIVIAKDPPRMVSLAATELQTYLEKISGARLPIVTNADSAAEGIIRIYIGKSKATDDLKITDEGLRYGAYRMASGSDYLVLLGNDFDFEPKEPWGKGRRNDTRAEQEWDELTADKTDSAWEFPMGAVYKAFNKPTRTWAHDEGGSLQAVYGFLRSLGVRWYLPGELGEVVPNQKSIALPEDLNETVHPDYALRQYIGPAYFNAPEDTVMWSRRLGLNYGYELLGIGPKTHGFSRVHGRSEMQEAHPEYYALIGGKRDFKSKGTGHACWSSAGLVGEAAGYAKTLFDHYGEPTLQLSPQDGLRMCQCDQCAKLTPSDAVWGFLNRVAGETLKTHPERYLIGAAYTSYREPPTGIDQLNPNVIVRINNVGRPLFRNEEHWEWYQGLVKSWREKAASGKIIRVENNYYDTVMHPRSIARDLKVMKGISLGEMSEVAREKDASGTGQTWGRPGTNHLNLYINARFLWDADQDIEEVLSEYYKEFYGPAADKMRAAFDYAENNYSLDGRARLELPERVQLLEHLHEARRVIESGDSVFGKRIQFIIDEFDPLEDLQKKLEAASKRGAAPGFEPWNMTSTKWDEARANGQIDGKLDEIYWNLRGKLSPASGEKFVRENSTRFQILVADDALWIGIRCFETGRSGDVPAVAQAADKENPAVLESDHVQLLLETDAHSHYRIAIDPMGNVFDEDMAGGLGDGNGSRWDSNAEVGVHRDEESWSIEARIPLVPEAEGAGDPLHHVLFQRAPTELWPWYFNIVRSRSEGDAKETSAFAPVKDGEEVNDRFSFGKLARKR